MRSEYEVRFYLQENFGSGVYDLSGIVAKNGKEAAIQTLECRDLERGSRIEPFMHLDRSSAQDLFDNLWNQGFRFSKQWMDKPNEPAMRAHIDDLRAIAFKVLKIDKPTHD